MMPLYKYFTEERFAHAFLRKGSMRFGSLASYRGLEDGGVRGDPKDGTLHFAPPEGLEITMVADGMKLVGTSFSTAAQHMFVYCVSNELSAERAGEFGSFCVEITNPDVIVSRLRARVYATSRLDYARIVYGETEYRSYDKIPGIDWAFPERVVLIKPPEYASQKESRIALPLKVDARSSAAKLLRPCAKKAAVTAADLARMITAADGEGTRSIRVRAILALSLAAALWRSELVGLELRDLELVAEGVKLTIRNSKTDQDGEGQVIAVPNGKVFKLVARLNGWLAVRCGGPAHCSGRSIRRGA